MNQSGFQKDRDFLDRERFFKVLKSWLNDAAFYSLDEWLEDSLAGLIGEY